MGKPNTVKQAKIRRLKSQKIVKLLEKQKEFLEKVKNG